MENKEFLPERKDVVKGDPFHSLGRNPLGEQRVYDYPVR